MSGLVVERPPVEADQVVRRFYEALGEARLVEVLNLFSTDARVLDADGRESVGIRQIAASLIPYRTARRMSVERIDRDGPEVRAIVRTSGDRYRGVFSIRRGRIESLRTERL